MQKLKPFLVVCFFLLVSSALAQEDQIIFSHQLHVQQQEIACLDCHGKAIESENWQDVLMPEMQTCYSCHDEEETPCSACHTNADEPAIARRLEGFNSRFPHKLHVDKEGNNCLTCHKGVETAKTTQDFHLPTKEKCNACHVGADVVESQSKCFTCHEPSLNFLPATHQLNWRKDHGLVQQMDENSCEHCHQPTYCSDCHEGDNLNRQAHPLNYRYTHGLMAKGNKENCLTCHQEQAFCVDCHRSERVMPQNHALPTWANRIAGDGGEHVREAQIDFDACMSCHNDAYADVVCMTCHGN
ncbi:cytochrome c family protein [Caldithrix abyssi DSM 13497]|uniref:Cytochrome c family protein n=1 Tax=Caldithrix abyssi DSM 13497 TaxID=880073 RepID=H1XR70_CALAY|nr:cytochrome c3 family protein [Caldithrix abyssi]APF17073.1 doubled CXXCH domain-containing protein [Caldithrix abyssi DSM 13497]EHO41221.1 cytochrome c family protein [Caldithrix abyssi DSM 13497]